MANVKLKGKQFKRRRNGFRYYHHVACVFVGWLIWNFIMEEVTLKVE
jgi:hypothetical protein